MKHKKLILIMSLLIISFVYIVHPYVISRQTSVDSFKDQIIRFHIKANSDKEEDQALKLKIRDEILNKMSNDSSYQGKRFNYLYGAIMEDFI